MEFLRIKIIIRQSLIEAHRSMEARRTMDLLKCSYRIIIDLRIKRPAIK
jgi:hypothetical protein